MHLFLNGLGASAGAGLTYLYNVVPHLSALPNVRTTLAVQSHLRREFDRVPGITLIDAYAPTGAARRFWFEQHKLPELIRKSGADVLISAGNFALRKSPVPQILLSGNSLYTSGDFYHDLHSRGEYGTSLDTRIKGIFARKSIHWADRTVAPSQAFADELQRWTGKQVTAIHHGFDHEAFFRDQSPLPEDVQEKLESGKGHLRLLFVSHYNYYRNFETLFRAIPLLRQTLNGRKVRLFLTCKLQDSENPGAYRTNQAAALIDQLGIREEVVELGTVPYRLLHQVYRACDIYVTTAYTETFAHPLVEAMASRLPIVASDLPVHREVCGEAAEYFPSFHVEDLAKRVATVFASKDLRSAKAEHGRTRSLAFSWDKHVHMILELLDKAATHDFSCRG